MDGAGVVLIVISNGDIASKNQGLALIKKLEWSLLDSVEEHPAYRNQHVRMWWLPDRILWEDHLDRRWQEATGEIVSEVIFPSRHAARSGRPSLTLHPIGIPQVPVTEDPPYGGRASRAVPPNPRISSWWKLMNQMKKEAPHLDEFELSLEVTHHGPYLDSPSLFIEIGSTKETWGHQEAADFLADIMIRGLGLDGGLSLGDWNPSEKNVIVLTVGGGHYAPRANYLALLPHVWLGHMLASYALPFETEDSPGNQWKISMKSALESTQKAYPGGQIICFMEKKAFKGWQRRLLKEFCQEQGIDMMTRIEIEDLVAS